MPIVVQDPRNVLIDGLHAGSIVDCIANYPKQKAPLLAAIDTWGKDAYRDAETRLRESVKVEADKQQAERKTEQERAKTELDAEKAARADELATKQTERDALVAQHADALAAKDDGIRQQQALIDALGGTPLGQQLAREKRKQQLVAEIKVAEEDAARKQKELEELES